MNINDRINKLLMGINSTKCTKTRLEFMAEYTELTQFRDKYPQYLKSE